MDNRRKIRVGMLFFSTSSSNLGVGALTLSQVDILRRQSAFLNLDLEIKVFDWIAARKPYVTGDDVEIIRLYRRILLNPFKLMQLFGRCDLLIDIGAGDSFADIYGMRRLMRLFYLKFLGRFSCRSYVHAPQTYGPFSHPLSRLAASYFLRRSNLVASRDGAKGSEDLLYSTNAPIIGSTDIAFGLPFKSKAHGAGLKPNIGINVSGLLMAGGYSGKNQFGLNCDYTDFVEKLINAFQVCAPSAKLHLIPHVVSPEFPAEDDYSACEKLKKAFPVMVLPRPFNDPIEAKSYISNLDFFVGSRMHSCIAAVSTGVATVPIAYSGKFAPLFNELGYDTTQDLRSMDAEELVQKCLENYQNMAMLKVKAKTARRSAQAMLEAYETALSAEMKNAARTEKDWRSVKFLGYWTNPTKGKRGRRRLFP